MKLRTRVLTPSHVQAMAASTLLYDVDHGGFIESCERTASYAYTVEYDTLEPREVGHTQKLTLVDMGPRNVEGDENAIRADELANNVIDLIEADPVAAGDVLLTAIGGLIERLESGKTDSRADHIVQLRQCVQYIYDVCRGKERGGYREIEERILRDFGDQLNRW